MLFAPIETDLEVRKARDGSHNLVGRFPYNSLATLSDGGRGGRPKKERFAPRAFAYRVEREEKQIHLLSGHDYGKPLASRSTGTLSLKDSDEALTFQAKITPQIADTSFGVDALAMIYSGLAYGISPGFRLPPKRRVEKSEEIEDEGHDPENDVFNALIRTVLSALLYEISVVTRPAYTASQIEARNWNPETVTPVLPIRRPYTWR